MTDARIQEIMRRARRGDFGSLNRDELLVLVRGWHSRAEAELAVLSDRIAELEAQWASVPWGELDDAFGNFFGEAWADEGSPVDTIDKWLTAYSPTSAPKEGDNG